MVFFIVFMAVGTVKMKIFEKIRNTVNETYIVSIHQHQGSLFMLQKKSNI